MTPSPTRRMALPVVLAAAVVVAAIGLLAVRASAARPTAGTAVVSTAAVAVHPGAVPATRGLGTKAAPKGAEVHASITAVHIVTTSCPHTRKSETRVGLMKNTSVYSHCDFP